jgi:hypothetical protein
MTVRQFPDYERPRLGGTVGSVRIALRDPESLLDWMVDGDLWRSGSENMCLCPA